MSTEVVGQNLIFYCFSVSVVSLPNENNISYLANIILPMKIIFRRVEHKS